MMRVFAQLDRTMGRHCHSKCFTLPRCHYYFENSSLFTSQQTPFHDTSTSRRSHTYRQTRANCTTCNENTEREIAPSPATAAATTEQIDEHYMRLALEQAQLAYAAAEVPVGAVLVNTSTGDILSAAHNATEMSGDPTAHAEILCIRTAAQKRKAWRLLDATLYVTLEPCPMCAGALLQSRVGRVVYGAPNSLLGADGSWIDMMRSCSSSSSSSSGERGPYRPHPFHPDLEVTSAVMGEECSLLMKAFFRERRLKGGYSSSNSIGKSDESGRRRSKEEEEG